MTLRAKVLVCVVVAGSIASLFSAQGHPSDQWVHFFVYLVAVLLSSGMKVAMPKTDGTMSVNFPFILLGLIQLSPAQAITLAVASVIAQCRIKVVKSFTLIQIVFNVANVTTATTLAWFTYQASLGIVHGEVAPALAIAATVYFLANTIPLALILAWESGTPAHRQWLQEFLWYYPFYLIGAMLTAAANYIGIQFGWLTSMLLIPMVYTVYRAYRAQMNSIRDREQHIVEIEALHMRTIEGLAMAVEAKDKNTHRHLIRVRVYVSELGKAMGLDAQQMKALLTASFLHDIGKLAVPEYILNKPGKLTPEEFEKMKIHTVVGAEILERVRFPYPVVPIVRSHHEAWDGSGYPDGLKGEEIPIGARILTTVDYFDALASERPYRRALPIEQAMAMVKSRAGTQLDPTVVRLLEERFVELEELANQHSDEILPLNTNLFVERGAAPAAGFAVERESSSSAAGGPSAAFAFPQGKSPVAGEDADSVVARQLQPLVPFDCFAIYLKVKDALVPQYFEGRHAQAFSAEPIPLGDGLSGWVALNHLPIVNGNPTVEPNLLEHSGIFTASSSALSTPLADAGGSLKGVVTLYSIGYAAFSSEHLRILQSFQPAFFLSLRNLPRLDKLPVLEGSSL